MATRREQVLDAAVHVAAESGLYGLTHRRVDAYAGAPVGTTANFCRTRQALTLAVLDLIAERLSALDATAVDRGADTEQWLVALLRHRLDVLLGEDAVVLRAFWRLASETSQDTDPVVYAKMTDLRATRFDQCRQVVTTCGSTDPDTHGPILFALMAALQLAEHTFPGTDFDPARMLAPPVRGLVAVIERDAKETAHGTP